MDLIQNQRELQKEAHEVLAKLNLLNILSIYGKPEIVGSLSTGLMTWRDIDIELVGEIDEDKYWKVVKEIFHTPEYKRTIVIDFRKSNNPNTPKGLHICITDYDFKNDGNLWKVDIWFLDRKPGEPNFNDWIKDKITPANKIVLLSLKKEVKMSPTYGKEIFSVDIYKAVIENGVRDLEGFKKYLSNQGRSLD